MSTYALRRHVMQSTSYRRDRDRISLIKENEISSNLWQCLYYSVDAPHGFKHSMIKVLGGNCKGMLPNKTTAVKPLTSNLPNHRNVNKSL